MSLIRKHGAVLQAWACLALVALASKTMHRNSVTRTPHRSRDRWVSGL